MVCDVEGLGIRYSDETIFSGVTFQLFKGGRCGVFGDSGSGKTTLLRLLAEMLPRAVDVTGKYQVAGRIGYIPQEGLNSLSPFLTVGRQVSNLSGSRVGTECWLAQVGLGGTRFYTSYPHQLSGGERQRVLVAQALALAPELILADEPTANLDPEMESKMLKLLDDFARKTGAAILITSHRDRVFRQLACDMVYLTPPAEKNDFPPASFMRQEFAVKARRVAKAYAPGGLSVLEDVSFRIQAGECVAILGRSGAGKSTLARCIAGREKLDRGSIECAGAVQLVRQEPSESLNPRFTIREALAEALIDRPVSLDSIGLPVGWMDRKIETLSEGQRARIAILRGAESLQENGVLILDESFAGLDARTRRGIVTFLNGLRQQRGLAILLITHDREAAIEMGARVLVLEKGRIE